jgi:ParB family chromosome partitioning protein
MGTKVQLTSDASGKGKISIAFKNDDELLRLMELFDTMVK